MKEYYVYIHYRLSDGSPFYVGKGKGRRMHVTRRNIYWNNIVNKSGFKAEKIEDGLTEEEALRLETYWIWQLRSWNYKLANQIVEDTKKMFSAESKIRMSESHKGQIAWNTGHKKIQPLKFNRAAEIRICLFCQKDFLARKDKHTKFCDLTCSNKYNKSWLWWGKKKAS